MLEFPLLPAENREREPNWSETFGRTVRRKAVVVEAVRGGWIPIEEVCELYSISVDEFLAWERDLDRYGLHGLRTTRYQIYRDTDKRAPAISGTTM